MSQATVGRQDRRRYWRQRETAAPLWPWGFLLPLLLFLLWLYGAFRTAPVIEQEIVDLGIAELQSLGYRQVSGAADGQRLQLRARAPIEPIALTGPAAQTFAATVGRAIECDTWLGPMVCPTSAQVSIFDDLEANNAALNPAIVAESLATAVLPAPAFSFTLDHGALTLSGAAPGEQEKAVLLERAQRQFANVSDSLTITGANSGADWQQAATQALALLSHYERGRITWDGKLLRTQGLIVASNEEALQQEYHRGNNQLHQAALTYRLAKTATACDTAFARSLADTKISFATNSADIDPSSTVLLATLASLANDCPGNLIIEGHTDSTGAPAWNKVLSLARATAVQSALREQGVAASRMRVFGFGAERPINNNATRSGRADNRRIVISTAGASDP